ncbi:hypothetical protein ACJMK2_011519 [Sinanodonta woodiana]|uniref:CASP C-terminal domain-containing protein n=1 Tax=Sinanodonta woodiana TaxID=1069815 RepID=A0ABD3V598_SINWO
MQTSDPIVIQRTTERYKQLQVEYQEAVSTVQEQKQLIHQLEEDLRSMNALSSMFRGDAEGTETKPSTPSAELMAEAIKEAKLEGSFSMYDTPSSKYAANSLLPIVQSQRERYRIRALELEAQVLSQQQQVSMFQNEMDKLRSDNVKLYEKIRYLQSAGYPHREKITGDDGTLNRYSTQYEEKLDPFSSFSRKEKTRKYMNLKPYDKITLSMGKFIMGNKLARTITFFYTLLLHCLIFLVLYKLAHTESCKRDLAAECQQQFAEHMLNAHANNHLAA